MQLLVLDTETTGLDPQRHTLIEIAAILWDTERHSLSAAPRFHTLCEPSPDEWLAGDPFALDLNRDLITLIHSSPVRAPSPQAAVAALMTWVNRWRLEKVTPVGKNVAGFDIPFLVAHGLNHKHIGLTHRSIDPALFYIKWQTDECPPSLDECCRRAGIKASTTHRAAADCELVARLLLLAKWGRP